MALADACDLHTHSTFSDGTLSPEELVNLSIRQGLSHVALCDHNTIYGLERFLRAAKGKNFAPIAGCEFTTDYLGNELHILGLFIPESAFDRVTQRLCEYHEQKEKSNILLIDSLNRAGYKLSFERLVAKSEGGQINRANIAAELTRLCYTASIKEAFKTLLCEEAGHFIPPQRSDAFETIKFIREIGAVPVLAHPFLSLDYAQLVGFLPLAKQNGLTAMECIYSTFTLEETALASELCERFSLLKSGGSDFHGDNKPSISLGVGTGNLFVPSEFAEKLHKSV